MVSTNRENSPKKSVFSFLSDSKNLDRSNDCKSVHGNKKFLDFKEKDNTLHHESACDSGTQNHLTSSVACKISNSAWASGQKKVKTRRALLGNVARESQVSKDRKEISTCISNHLTLNSLKESIDVKNSFTDVSVNVSASEANGNHSTNSSRSLPSNNNNFFIQKKFIGDSLNSKILVSENGHKNRLNTDIKVQLKQLPNVNPSTSTINLSNETVASISAPGLDGLSLLTGVYNFLVLQKQQLNERSDACRREENVFDITFHRERLLDEVNQLKKDQNESILREDYVKADTIDQLIKQTQKKLEDFEETTCSFPFACFVEIEEAFNEKYIESTNVIQNVLNQLDTIQHTIIKETKQKITSWLSVMEKDFEHIQRNLFLVEDEYKKINFQKEGILAQQERLNEEILKRSFVYEGTRQKAVAKESQLDREIEDLEAILAQKREFRHHLKNVIVKNEIQIKKIESDFKTKLCDIQSATNQLNNKFKTVEYKRKRLITDRALLEKKTKIFTNDVKEVTLQMGMIIVTRHILRQYIIFSFNQVRPLQNALISLATCFTNITGSQSLAKVRHTISRARQKIESHLLIVNDLKMKQLVLQNQLDQFSKQKDQAVELRQFRDAACFTKEIQRVTAEMETLVLQVDSNEKDLNDAFLTIQDLEPEENKLRDSINHFMCFAGDNFFQHLQMYKKSIASIVNPVEHHTISHCDKTCLPCEVFLEKSIEEYLLMVENGIHQMALQTKSKFLYPPSLVQHIANNLKRQFFQHPFIQVSRKILHAFFSLFRVEEMVCDSLRMTCLRWTAQENLNNTNLIIENKSLKKIEEKKKILAFLYFCKMRQRLVEFNPFAPSNAQNFLNDLSYLAECIITVREMKNLFLTFNLSNKKQKSFFVKHQNFTKTKGLVSEKLRSSSFSYHTPNCLTTDSLYGLSQQTTRHHSAILLNRAAPNNMFFNSLDKKINDLTVGIKICTNDSPSKIRSLSI
ncbi:uncharacterized protein LOC128884253 isoform X2 [Hylaeus volcanicus]|uniref:uncharacterized protein LOC128884253 isoform X2 n=1 Tax=Hylaeus volcanicus TaxID=313075 RepID=UPI0023B7F312|nr:uncharacterized protein LOC128884253 isoform X2 [Hylaeus volcanicus]